MILKSVYRDELEDIENEMQQKTVDYFDKIQNRI